MVYVKKIENPSKIRTELQNKIQEFEKHGKLEDKLKGFITFKQQADYQEIISGFEKHYHGFQALDVGEISVFECPAKYIKDIEKHDEVLIIEESIQFQPF